MPSPFQSTFYRKSIYFRQKRYCPEALSIKKSVSISNDRYTSRIFHTPKTTNKSTFSAYITHQILVVAILKEPVDVDEEVFRLLRILIILRTALIGSSIFHHLMPAMIMLDEILNSLLDIRRQSPLAEHILVKSHVLMVEISRQEIIKMADHIPHPLDLLIIAPESLLGRGQIVRRHITFNNKKVFHVRMVVLMILALRKSSLRLIVLIILICGGQTLKLIDKIF